MNPTLAICCCVLASLLITSAVGQPQQPEDGLRSLLLRRGRQGHKGQSGASAGDGQPTAHVPAVLINIIAISITITVRFTTVDVIVTLMQIMFSIIHAYLIINPSPLITWVEHHKGVVVTLLDAEISTVARVHDQRLRQLAFGTNLTSFSAYFLDNLKKSSSTAVRFAFAQDLSPSVDSNSKSAASLTLDQTTPTTFTSVIKVWGEGSESKFGPVLEYVLQRIQTIFSVYKHEDQSRPGVPVANAITEPKSAADKSTTTTEDPSTSASSATPAVQPSFTKKGLHPLLARKKFQLSSKEHKAKATAEAEAGSTTAAATSAADSSADSSSSSDVSPTSPSGTTRRTRPTRPLGGRVTGSRAPTSPRTPRTTTKRTTSTTEASTTTVRSTRARRGRPTRPNKFGTTVKYQHHHDYYYDDDDDDASANNYHDYVPSTSVSSSSSSTSTSTSTVSSGSSSSTTSTSTSATEEGSAQSVSSSSSSSTSTSSVAPTEVAPAPVSTEVAAAPKSLAPATPAPVHERHQEREDDEVIYD
ncbi:conserved hypothetical protein [Culex quinquefasciatus]|uniref:Uncharacterized protein n=1 Tax=Culex quinquefasciatus TaxID=7176 RepID=B0WI38_CULQU|nr:conserved hypothetical protein [Culex quinquefasciatus]|eukprot:XP_001848372.1 conserved hypothetical protein [Culex quinquefasciatus]